MFYIFITVTSPRNPNPYWPEARPPTVTSARKPTNIAPKQPTFLRSLKYADKINMLIFREFLIHNLIKIYFKTHQTAPHFPKFLRRASICP